MPRAVAKKTAPAHGDPVVWGVTGAYVVGILMAGLIGVMVSPVSFQSDLEYNQGQAAAPNEPSTGSDRTGSASDGAVVIDNANMLANGSFELPIIRSQSKLLTEIPGWSISWATTIPGKMSLTRQPGVELLAGYQSWQAAEGAQFARLDTADLGARSARTQSLVTLTQSVKAPTGVYRLAFDFAAQPKTATKENEVEIKWNGKVLGTVTADGSKDSKPQWKNYSYTVTVTGNDTLTVTAKGTENNQGVLVDNFSLAKTGR